MALLANGIDVSTVLGIGFFFILPLLLFNALVEAPILSRWVGWPWKKALSPLLKANMWSLLAGVPVTMLNSALSEWLLPQELVARMHSYPVAIWFWVLNYFFFTVLIEYWWFRARLDKPAETATKRALLKGVLLANIASYAVLAPICWWQAQPRQTVKEFTHDTSWARPPATQVVYIDPSGWLSSIQTDESNRRTLLTNQMVEFVISEDVQTVLFRNSSNQYYLARKENTQRIEAPSLPALGWAMDFSPSGDAVALVPFESGTVYVWKGSLRPAIHIPDRNGGDPFTRLYWSTNDQTFYFIAEETTYEVTVSDSSEGACSVKPIGTNGPPPGLARHYARLGTSFHRSAFGPEPAFAQNYIRDEDARSMVLDYAGGGLRASHKDKRIRVFDNPGVAHFGRRQLRDPGFTSNYDEIVFRDALNLYLADMDRQRVGRLAPGGAFVLISPMYCKAEFRR